MEKTYFKQIFILSSLCVLSACAMSNEGPDTADSESEFVGNDCISQSTIRDYQVLDESNLIVTSGVKRKYHVKLSRRAFGLRSTWQIAFKSPTGRICRGSGELIVNDGLGFNETIRISSIQELMAEEVDDLLIQFGKKEPEIKQAPATEKMDGAEVEELD